MSDSRQPKNITLNCMTEKIRQLLCRAMGRPCTSYCYVHITHFANRSIKCRQNHAVARKVAPASTLALVSLSAHWQDFWQTCRRVTHTVRGIVCQQHHTTSKTSQTKIITCGRGKLVFFITIGIITLPLHSCRKIFHKIINHIIIFTSHKIATMQHMT